MPASLGPTSSLAFRFLSQALPREITSEPVLDATVPRAVFCASLFGLPLLLSLSTLSHQLSTSAKRFLVHNVWHLGRVAAVIPFQHVDQCLDGAPGHAFVGIDREPSYLRTTGEVMEQTRAIGDFWIEQRRIRRQRLFLKDIERR